MEKFPHQQFIEDNKIELSTLPTMLRKRIEGFNELQDDLQHTVEEDQEALLSKLETLSHELAEDLEEQFEDELENNDVEEHTEESAETPEKIPLSEPLPEKEAETEGTDTSEQTLHEEAAAEEEEEPVEEQTDESLLEELHNGKMLLVLPAHLMEMGFKTPLTGKQVIVGKFILRKGKYDKRYTISLK